MDVPDLVRARLGDEEIMAGVSTGDENAVYLTSTRTLVYRGEGILSDEHVEEFPHDAERLSMKTGRRKTKFVLEYVEGPKTFTVPSNRGETVLELLLQGILRHAGVLDSRESIVGVYRFTELTLVVTESRLLKHIGNRVWDDDFENYPFEDVTGLDFERASNATSIAVAIEGRPQRIKVPNDTARIVRQTVENALFDYYEVDSIEALNAAVGDPDSDPEAARDANDIGFEAGIDPLVTDADTSDTDTGGGAADTSRAETGGGVADTSRADTGGGAADTSGAETGGGVADTSGAEARDSAVPDRMDVSPSSNTRSEPAGGSESESTAEASESTAGTDAADASAGEDGDGGESLVDARVSGGGTGSGGRDRGPDTDDDGPDRSTADSGSGASPGQEGAESTESQDEDGTHASRDAEMATDDEPASRAELEAVTSRVEDLTEAVQRQNELLRRQHRALEQLVEEVRSE